MILLDANVLLHAHNTAAAQHDAVRRWLREASTGPLPLRVAWVSLLAFLRISTNPRAFVDPLRGDEAAALVARFLAHPGAGILDPGERHLWILTGLIKEAQVSGSLMMDAHLAALALEHGVQLATTDRDFRRFRGLRLVDPAQR